MKQSNRLFKPLSFDNPWLMANQWYATALGQALFTQETHYLNKVLEQIFGYNLIQLGDLRGFELSKNSRTSYQSIIHSSPLNSSPLNLKKGKRHIMSHFSDLAIQNQSIDAVLLPHTLEFEQDPHQILREVERILIAEGKAIFLGFNPYSLYGLWHKYWEVKAHVIAQQYHTQHNKQYLPLASCSHLISQRRLQDWLQLLGFDIERVDHYFYRPPINRSLLLKQLEFMEQVGKTSTLLPAGAYLMVATKRISTLTPIQPHWKLSKSIISSDTIKVTG